MIDTCIMQGRQMGPVELAQIRDLIAAHPEWSRYQISRHLAVLWNWRNPLSQLKDMAARTLLLKLEQRGWITLPPCRWASPNRMRQKQQQSLLEMPALPPSLTASLRDLLPLSLLELSLEGSETQRAQFRTMLHQHHYLSHRGTVGENLQYMVRDNSDRLLACVLFGAAAWQCKARDQHIGWDAPTRQRGLPYVANNTRFLILPWVRVPHLASHVLGRIARRLCGDWQRKYGHAIHLLETFVDTSRFQGVCYRAANWQKVGMTTGRTRQNKTMIPQAPPKAVWLYPLRKDFRKALCAL